MQERMIKQFRKRLTRQGVPTELLRCLAFWLVWLVVHFPQKRCFGRVVSGPGRRFPRHICHQTGESSVVVTKYVDASFSLLLPWGPLHRALTIWTEWAVTRRSFAQLGSRWHCKRFFWYLLLSALQDMSISGWNVTSFFYLTTEVWLAVLGLFIYTISWS